MSAEQAALSRAQGLVAVRRWQEAIDVLGPALGSPETAATAHCLRAQCQLALGHPHDAERSAKDALAHDPSSEWAYRLLSAAYLGTRQRRAARDAAEQALRLDPDSVAGYQVLAMALLSLLDAPAAREAASAAVKADPDDPVAHETLAIVLAQDNDWKGAEQSYREALRLAPEDPELALGLADALRRQRRKDEASAAFLAAARSDPTDERARQGLARLGVPVLGSAGAAILGVSIAQIIAGWQRAKTQPITATAIDVAVVIAVVLCIAAIVATALRFHGTRKLPRELRRGLSREHRRAAWGWLRIAAYLAMMLGAWSAISPTDGGEIGTAACFFAFAAVSAFVANRFRGDVPMRHRWRRLSTWSKRAIAIVALLVIGAAATVGQPGPCIDHADNNCTPHVTLGGSVTVDGLTWKVQNVRTARTLPGTGLFQSRAKASGRYVLVTVRAHSDREATLLGVELHAPGKTYHQDPLVAPALTENAPLIFQTLEPGDPTTTWATVFDVPSSVLSQKVEVSLEELFPGGRHGYIDITRRLG